MDIEKNTTDERRRAVPLLTDAVVAAAAGYAGTKAMEPVSMKLYALKGERARTQEDAVRPGPPYLLAAKKTTKLFGLELDDGQMQKAGTAFHYGLALSWAPVYTVLRRRTGWSPLTSGLASGAAMSLIIDEGLTPALGFSAPNRAYPWQTHIRGFVAHLVFGLTVAVVTEGGWRLLGRR